MLETKNKQDGSISLFVAIGMSVLFLGTSIFAFWAYSESQKYKNDVDAIVADEVALAVQQTETAKETEFIEREKEPLRTYSTSSVFGSLSFSYPKTWSIYDDSDDEVLIIGQPVFVPGSSSDLPYALVVEVVNTPYDRSLDGYSSEIEQGTVSASAFRLEKVPDVLGSRLDGAISNDINGSVVLLPLRDKTIILRSESTEYIKDFNDIILPSVSYNP